MGNTVTISGKPLKDHEEVVGHARTIDLIDDLIRRDSDLGNGGRLN